MPGSPMTHVLGENYVVEELVNERNSLLANLVERWPMVKPGVSLGTSHREYLSFS